MEWIHDTGEFYLSTHTSVGESREESEELFKEYNDFKSTAKVRALIKNPDCSALESVLSNISVFCFNIFFLKETKEKVKLLIQLADNLVEKGHAHASSIKSWVAAVDKRYKDFSSRMEKYRAKLEQQLGYKEEDQEEV